MSNVAKLKKQAAEFEQKRQFDKALAVYVKLLDAFDQYADELDVALFNRVGDLMLRQGNVADALDYYEQAVDRYSDTGFFNNAIALCNKILRHSPGRASIYYKLGKISAQKGFKNDARTSFLEYADRMQKSGHVDEAFRALKEFADLCPDQDEIRLMLADQLTRLDRKAEAVEQLQILYARYQAEGREGDATAAAGRIRDLDPTVEIRAGGASQSKQKSSDLVFLDLDAPVGTPSISGASIAPPLTAPTEPSRPRTPARTPAQPGGGAADLPPTLAATPISFPALPLDESASDIDEPLVDSLADSLADSLTEAQFTRADVGVSGPEGDSLDDPLSGLSRLDDAAVLREQTPPNALPGLESTRLADDELTRTTPTSSLSDLEPTSLDESPPLHRSSAPTRARRDSGAVKGDLEFDMPPAQATPAGPPQPSIEFGRDALLTPLQNSPVVRGRPTPATPHGALEGLPLMDLDLPTAPPPMTPTGDRTPTSLPELTLDDDLDTGQPAPTPTPTRAADTAEVASTVHALDRLDLNEETLESDVPPRSSAAPRPSTLVALQAVEALRASVDGAPDDVGLRRELGEAMLEAGDRAHGIQELESAMGRAEQRGNLTLAGSLAEELARLEPEVVKHHQKRVEYAFRTNDRPRLIEAYLSLGDALLRAEQIDKARTVYQRVLDLAPADARARAAIDSLTAAAEPPAGAARAESASAVSDERARSTAPNAVPSSAAPGSFVNLGDWLRDDSGPKDTRMVVAEQEPTGDEEADFADMLRKFKQGVAENVDAEDYQSHYDLAIAFKEMGLLDEAIAEFQKALGSPTNRLPTYEALGQCFLEKGQPKLAMSILARALNEPSTEEQLVGVLYWLGRAAAELGLASEALNYYQRVFVLDIQFRDIAERMSEVERAAR